MNIIGNSALGWFLFIGILMVLLGIKIRKNCPRRFVSRPSRNIIDTIANNKYVRMIISCIVGDPSKPLYKFANKVINKGEVLISVESLYVLKFLVVFLVIIMFVLVRNTNIKYLKSILLDNITADIACSGELYCDNNDVLQQNSKNIDYTKLIALKQQKSPQAIVEYIANSFPDIGAGQFWCVIDKVAKVYSTIAKSTKINIGHVIAIFICFWSPEIFIILRRLLMNSRHKEEIIKLESVFELLGGIKNFKTIDILDEMCRVSKVYNKNIKTCRDKFLIDKQVALEQLKAEVKVPRFKKMVDYIRIYAFVDKAVAVEVLERNRMQNEEETILTADEDVGLMDMIAFSSVLPVLLQLTELLLKPMMTTVIKAFSFI